MTKQKIKVLFEVVQEYYWPAMEPIYKILSTDPMYSLKVKIGPNHRRFAGIFLFPQQKYIEEKFLKQGYSVTRETRGFDAVVCGDTLKNPCSYGGAMLYNVDHGPCFKTLRYRNLLRQPDVKYVVFAEGPYRMRKLHEYGLDKTEMIYDVGLPKLDPFFTGAYSRETIIKKHNLDPDKKIVLYAPTYKPTSIFDIGEKITRLLDSYNLIVKLHPYSWSGKYAPHSHHKLFESIQAKHKSLHLVPPSEHDIMPYLYSADTLISEASSIINEFLALERCGVVFNLKDDSLKHSDGEPLLVDKTSDWLKNSFVHIDNADDLPSAIQEALNPSQQRKINLKRDKEFIYSSTNGKSSQRVKEIIEANYKIGQAK